MNQSSIYFINNNLPFNLDYRMLENFHPTYDNYENVYIEWSTGEIKPKDFIAHNNHKNNLNDLVEVPWLQQWSFNETNMYHQPRIVSSLNILDMVCAKIIEEHQLSKMDYERRQIVLERLQMIFAKEYPNIGISLFGSSINGFEMKNSDLDITLNFDRSLSLNKKEKKNFSVILLSNIASLLMNSREFTDIEERLTAKVPIIRFHHESTGINGDISIFGALALHNSILLQQYVLIDERTKKLGILVKDFAESYQIKDASCGSLSSYAYIIMVIHYLMNTSPAVLPCLQKLNKESFSKKETNLNIDGWDCWFNKDIKSLPEIWPFYKKNKQSVGELWLGFLRYYTEDFDWDNNVISIKNTDQLTKRSKNWSKHRLAIEDPFEINKNLAKRIKKQMSFFILQTFKETRYKLESQVDDLYLEETELNTPLNYYGSILINNSLYPKWSNAETIN